MDVVLASAQSDLKLALEMLLREEPGTNIVGTVTETEGLLALIQTIHSDLVFLDWDLPGRPCPEVLATAQSVNCQPTIIVLGKDTSAKQSALAAGADAFVLKGESPEQLLAAIRVARA